MSWIELSEKELQKQMVAFRICCALALREKVVNNSSRPLDWTVCENPDRSLKDVNYTIEDQEKKVLKLIGDARGLLSKDCNKIIDALNQEGKPENCLNESETRSNKGIYQLEMILYQVFRIMYADRYISYKEKMFFIFICIRLGVLNAETRKALYRRCKRKAILENIKDFNKYVEDKIKKIIGKGNSGKSLFELDEEIKELYDKINERIKEDKKNEDFYKKLEIFLAEDGCNKINELKKIYKEILGIISPWASGNKERNQFFENLRKEYGGDRLAKTLALSNIDDYLKKICDDETGNYEINYDRDCCQYINDSFLGDYRDYINAVVRIEKDVDEEAQKELELYGEINKSHGKDLARYVDYVTGDKMKPSEKADLLFDIFNVILADGKIEEKEDLLFKICTVILHIGIEEYKEIKKVLFEFQARTKEFSLEKRYNDSRFVTKRIKEILKKDKVFLKGAQPRFSLVCSMALVDGKIETREKVELYDIGLRDYYLNERQITEIIETLENKETQSRYFTEMLVNVPHNKKEKLKDLRNCRRIICSDDVITDAERNAFEMVCIFYGVDKEFFSSKDYIEKDKDKISSEYLTEIDDEKRVKITREAYEKIEHIIKNKQVQGPLCGGIQYALDKRFNEHCRTLIRSDRRTTKYAFVIFSISALLLLIMINHYGHESIGNYKYLHELAHYKELVKDTSYYNTAESIIAESIIAETLKKQSNDTIAYDSFKEKAADSINQMINGEDNMLVRRYNERSKLHQEASDSTLYVYVVKKVDNALDDTYKWLSDYHALFWLIFLTVLGVVILPIRRWISRIILKHNLYTISLLLIVLLAVSGALRTSVLLLSTMLSIEWLILMREKEAHNKKGTGQSHSKSHSSLLAILVIMAILADISFGMIELGQLYSLKNVSDKVFSALFLGCICFFVGKFMEMQYMHNIEDKERMQEAVKNISKYLR